MRQVVPTIDIDGDDLATADEIKNRGEKRPRPAVMGARLHDEIRPDLVNDLLVDNQVGGVLDHLHAQPVHPQLLVKHIIEVQTVESLHDLILASFPPCGPNSRGHSQQCAEHCVSAGPAWGWMGPAGRWDEAAARRLDVVAETAP